MHLLTLTALAAGCSEQASSPEGLSDFRQAVCFEEGLTLLEVNDEELDVLRGWVDSYNLDADPVSADEYDSDPDALIADVVYGCGHELDRLGLEALSDTPAVRRVLTEVSEAREFDPAPPGTAMGGSSSGPGFDRELAARGLSRADVRAVADVADRTGYGISASTPMTWGQAQDRAGTFLYVCDAIAEGATDWDAQIRDDIASGAPPQAAEEMNAYLRFTFCPALS